MKLKKIHFERGLAGLQILPAIAAIVATAASTDAAWATTNNNAILNTSCDTIYLIKRWIFNIAYILGAIGLVVIAVSAFLGRFKFAHLIALGGGLFIVAMADALITFATGGAGQNTCTDF